MGIFVLRIPPPSYIQMFQSCISVVQIVQVVASGITFSYRKPPFRSLMINDFRDQFTHVMVIAKCK